MSVINGQGFVWVLVSGCQGWSSVGDCVCATIARAIGWLRLTLGGFGWCWVVFAGVEWVWLVLGGFGWCWMVSVGVVWFWFVLLGFG